MKRGNGGLPVEHKDFERAGCLCASLFAHSLCAIVTPPPPAKYIPVL
ncbi:MAG: hypothetical protein LBK66_00965 [Spirochaetaceae bacterium]|nr:hypothetical protein [Spirochaetaceae bacterium]